MYCSGAVYIYSRSGSTWSQQAVLSPGNGLDDNRFGYAVSIDGDTAIVGAYHQSETGTNSGVVYVFVRSGSTWSLQTKLLGDDTFSGDFFGKSVAISGDTVIVGAPGQDYLGSASGSAYIFVRSSDVWIQQAKLTPDDGVSMDYFGRAVAISGDHVIVGTYNQYITSYKAYIFERSGSFWSQQATLTPDIGPVEELFGYSVSISGDTALVGSPMNDTKGTNAGAAYIFAHSGNTWMRHTKITADDANAGDRFGRAVSLSGNHAMVGAFKDDDHGTNSGSAYIFIRSAGIWRQQSKLTADDASADQHFGISVSISFPYFIAGAYNKDMAYSGSAYFYEVPPLAASMVSE